MTNALKKKLRPAIEHIVTTLLEQAADAVIAHVTERVTDEAA